MQAKNRRRLWNFPFNNKNDAEGPSFAHTGAERSASFFLHFCSLSFSFPFAVSFSVHPLPPFHPPGRERPRQPVFLGRRSPQPRCFFSCLPFRYGWELSAGTWRSAVPMGCGFPLFFTIFLLFVCMEKRFGSEFRFSFSGCFSVWRQSCRPWCLF